MRIGFIGLGTMGSAMAHRVIDAGHDVVVHDIDPRRAASHADAGATVGSTVAETARDADVVLTSVPGPTEYREVGVGSGGLLPAMRPGSAWIDLSTNSPTVVKEVALRFAEADVDVLDAPVSGGPKGAASGRLAIYVGGDEGAFERHRPLLGAIGDQVMRVGGVGAGNTAKLVHNLASLVTRMVNAEVFSLGVKAGVEPLDLWHALRQGATGRARTFDRMGDQYLQGRYEPAAFALELADKDYRLALQLAEDLDVPLTLGRAAHGYFEEALARGWGRLDSRAPMQIPNERAGVSIAVDAAAVEETLARD